VLVFEEFAQVGQEVFSPEQMGIAGFLGGQYSSAAIDQTDNNGVIHTTVLRLDMVDDPFMFYVGVISSKHVSLLVLFPFQ
jgi:hypothetical protein